MARGEFFSAGFSVFVTPKMPVRGKTQKKQDFLRRVS